MFVYFYMILRSHQNLNDKRKLLKSSLTD